MSDNPTLVRSVERLKRLRAALEAEQDPAQRAEYERSIAELEEHGRENVTGRPAGATVVVPSTRR